MISKDQKKSLSIKLIKGTPLLSVGMTYKKSTILNTYIFLFPKCLIDQNLSCGT